MRKLLLLCSLLLLFTAGAARAAESSAEGTASATRPTNESTIRQTSGSGNVYTAGPDLRILTAIPGDLLAAGGRVSVERKVGADAALAAGTVDVRAPVAQDLRAAGGTVNIESSVGGDLVVAGGTIRISHPERIGGSAWVAGGQLHIGGRIGKGARIYGNSITLAAEIDGDTHIVGEQIDFAPSARINGNLSYASPRALTDAQRAQVSGNVKRMEMPYGRQADDADDTWFPWFSLLWLLSMLLFGTLLYLIFPGAILGAQRAIGERPGLSLLAGLALLFTVPPVAILFMVTVIGIPVGFALLMLYPLALLLGYLATAFFLSRKAASATRQPERLSMGKQIAYLLLALLLLAILLAIPFLGFMVFILAVVFGLGGWAVWVQARYRRPAQAA